MQSKRFMWMDTPLQPLRIPTGWTVAHNEGLYEIIRRHGQWRVTTAFGHRVFTDRHLSRQTLIARTSNSWQGFTLGTEVCHLANDT
jgi:hypothetical protein